MKVQWKSVSEEQEMRNSLFRGYRSLIGQFISLSSPCWVLVPFLMSLLEIDSAAFKPTDLKQVENHKFVNLICGLFLIWTERDVNRTDRHNSFFSGNENPGLALLHDVLMTYCMYNFDLGKCF